MARLTTGLDPDLDLARENPADGEHIHGGLNGPVAEAVFTDAGDAGSVVYGDFSNAIAHAFYEGGDKPVHSVEGQEGFLTLAAHGFEGATGVADTVFCEAGADGVREFGGETLGERVFAVGPVAANEVVAFIEFCQKARDIGGIVLAVAVHQDDDVAFCGVDPGVHGAALAGVFLELEYADMRGAGDFAYRGVGRFIVYEDDFEIAAGESSADLFAERSDVVFFVIKRNDDRKHGG